MRSPCSFSLRAVLVVSAVGAVSVACATGEQLTDEELQMLQTGISQASTLEPTSTGATATGVTAGGGSGSMIVGTTPAEPPPSGLNTTVPQASQSTARPDVMEMGSTEIVAAPEAKGTGGGSSSTVGGSAGSESGSTSTGTTGGFFGTPAATTPPATTPPATECGNFDDSECSSLPDFAVSWCTNIIACANGPSCDPTPTDPLCSQPEANETPCTSTIWMSGGYQEQGYAKALDIASAACGG